jgi:hypothetical protein
LTLSKKTLTIIHCLKIDLVDFYGVLEKAKPELMTLLLNLIPRLIIPRLIILRLMMLIDNFSLLFLNTTI